LAASFKGHDSGTSINGTSSTMAYAVLQEPQTKNIPFNPTPLLQAGHTIIPNRRSFGT
jgi:hypothetical protein